MSVHWPFSGTLLLIYFFVDLTLCAGLPKQPSHYKFQWHRLARCRLTLPFILSSSREEMPSPKEVYFKDSPVCSDFSLPPSSLNRTASQPTAVSVPPSPPVRPFSQQVKHWFVNGKGSTAATECSSLLLSLCVCAHTSWQYTTKTNIQHERHWGNGHCLCVCLSVCLSKAKITLCIELFNIGSR